MKHTSGTSRDYGSSVERKYVRKGEFYCLFSKDGGLREVTSGATPLLTYGHMVGEVCLIIRAVSNVLLIDHGSNKSRACINTDILMITE